MRFATVNEGTTLRAGPETQRFVPHDATDEATVARVTIVASYRWPQPRWCADAWIRRVPIQSGVTVRGSQDFADCPRPKWTSTHSQRIPFRFDFD